MKELLEILKSLSDKISTYQIYNFLLPGAAFLTPLAWCYALQVPKTSLWQDIFICYFTGMIISRVSTFVFESWASKFPWNWLKVELIDYPVLVKVEHKDAKIASLLQVSNTYRSMASSALMLLVVIILNAVCNLNFIFPNWLIWLCIFLVILFYFSFRKQYGYVRMRVEARNGEA